MAKATGYLTRREERAIAKENRRQLSKYRREAKQSVSEEQYLTQMKNPENVVEFDGLRTYFYTDAGVLKAVDGVTFSVPAGKTVGVVGESGCGKSITSLSLMRLLPQPQGQIAGGELRFHDGTRCYRIDKTPEQVMRRLRGKEIGMIFQEPMTSLNPVFRIERQLTEVLRLHTELPEKQLRARAEELLLWVGIANAAGVLRMYPHELSGGMRQRIVIAMAIACNPRLIIADEPTTALDVTIQAQILELLGRLKQEFKCSILLITHDLGVIAEMADFVVVMYAGRIVERGTVEEIFDHPAHPYTIGLMASKPTVTGEAKELYSIPGRVPNPVNLPEHCYFMERCGKRCADCRGGYPQEIWLSETHAAACGLAGAGGAEADV